MKMRARINAMCKTCTYDPLDRGTCAQQIACCTVKSCPLHPVRPITTKEIPFELIRGWNIDLLDLDEKARRLVPTSSTCPPEPQNDVLLDLQMTSWGESNER